MAFDATTPADVTAFVERIRQRQQEIERIRRGIETMEVVGGSRDGEVQVTVRGNGQVADVTIDQDLLRRGDAQELGEIVKEAVNDGLRRLAEASSARLKPVLENTAPADWA